MRKPQQKTPDQRTSSRFGMQRGTLHTLPIDDYSPPPLRDLQKRIDALKSSGTVSVTQQVLAVIKMRRTYGATDLEVQQLLELSPNTEVPLRHKLVRRKQVVWSGRYRRTHSLAHINVAKVWIVAN